MQETLGQVVAVQANFYRVLVPELTQVLLCTRRALLKKMGQSVCVGDRVTVAEIYGDRGVITAVADRDNYLARPAIANLEQIILICALAEPAPAPWQISRFLVHCQSAGVPVVVGFSKADLVSANFRTAWIDRLGTWGYSGLAFSTVTGEGMTELRSILRAGISLITGPSGAGKSSLLNSLIPSLSLSTGEVSQRSKTGKHTTRHVELFALDEQTLIADSPGFLQPELQCAPQDLAYYFPEITDRLLEGSCQFPDCGHRDEPNCIVRGDWERYDHYCTWLEELESADPTALPQQQYKQKSAKEGNYRREVLLSKKQRQESRRTSKVRTESRTNSSL